MNDHDSDGPETKKKPWRRPSFTRMVSDIQLGTLTGNTGGIEGDAGSDPIFDGSPDRAANDSADEDVATAGPVASS